MPWRSHCLHAGSLLRQQWRLHTINRLPNEWIRHESTSKLTRPPSRHTTYTATDTKSPAANIGTSTSTNDPEAFPPISIKLLSKEGEKEDLSPLLTTSFSRLQPEYQIPRYPIVLAHGLMGFDELRLAGQYLPSLHYWRGIKDAFNEHGIECITTAVPTTGSIDERAKALYSQILEKLPAEPVNIVAHSMGGLDARYLISRLCPDPTTEFQVASLTTVATPHRGSSAADMLFRDIGPDLLPRLYRLLERLKISSGAFSQLTTPYINSRFNPVTPNSASTRYFSYGATATPHLLSVFRISHDLLAEVEGPNDGLVSVRSARWGEYKGTLVGVTHLDLINWTNRIKNVAARLGLVEQKFNAVAFYLGVADMLAKEGL
ncbi:triacylglycerol lipase [Exophiala aquamarina CBS 119918]|uniref:Triacylglycerol lipase n=1 Tax=Exophiala aquamarina CBS 119918 TaxID=1182545 RepID=A0A072PC83_9EURO|nr:triacylglycerol lipase [Exophiala aquamarina CBS 119918]KEF56898.1 triacylglycerol lipase [Exophiala aquamarina CBS 119918]